MNAILTFLLLTLCILMHEAGHYFVARRCGIAVSEFFIGFGPKIFSFKKNGTEYGLKAIFLGGYVKIPGMDENEDTTEYNENELFSNASWKSKLFVSSSGVIVNLVISFVLIAIIFSSVGMLSPTLEIESLGETISNREYPPSYEAGLKKGDKIFAFNRVELDDWEHLVALIEQHPNSNVEIQYLRGNKIFSTIAQLDSRIIDGKSYGYLGVAPKLENINLTPLQVVSNTSYTIVAMSKSVFQGMFTLFSFDNLALLARGLMGEEVPNESRPLSPIGLAQAGSQIAESGYINLLSLIAFVNIFLAIFNAIPLIPLDGGRMMLAIIEGATGRTIPDRKLYPLAFVVVGLFIFLGITAFYLDITQPIKL